MAAAVSTPKLESKDDAESKDLAVAVPASLEPAFKALAELVRVRDAEFCKDPKEKTRKLDGLRKEVEAALEALPEDVKASSVSWIAHARGQALDCSSEAYSAAAEEELAKAVKLDPSNIDAWNALGACFWKKGDLEQAKNCFEGALGKRKNAESLRQLSMLLRRMGSTAEESAASIRESVEKAKAAVALNLSDGESWYVLGNAYLSLFLAVDHNPESLATTKKAYTKALEYGAGGNPDLHFNRGNVLKFQEEFKDAAASYAKAAAIDPGLDADEEVGDIDKFVTKLADLVARKGRMKPKRLKALVKTLPNAGRQKLIAESPAAEGRPFVNIASLKEGPNAHCMVLLKLVIPCVRTNKPPAALVMADAAQDTVSVSLYHLDDKACDGFNDKDIFIVMDPVVKTVEYKDLSYKSIQIHNPSDFIVNGRSLKSNFAHASLAIKHFPW